MPGAIGLTPGPCGVGRARKAPRAKKRPVKYVPRKLQTCGMHGARLAVSAECSGNAGRHCVQWQRVRVQWQRVRKWFVSGVSPHHDKEEGEKHVRLEEVRVTRSASCLVAAAPTAAAPTGVKGRPSSRPARGSDSLLAK